MGKTAGQRMGRGYLYKGLLGMETTVSRRYLNIKEPDMCSGMTYCFVQGFLASSSQFLGFLFSGFFDFSFSPPYFSSEFWATCFSI